MSDVQEGYNSAINGVGREGTAITALLFREV